MKFNGSKYTNAVPFSKRKGSVYLEIRMKLELQISDSDWVRAICIHEAAHIFYFRQFGATEFIYHGPRMDYDRERGAYVVQCAAVGPEPYTKKALTFEQQLEIEARLAVSGSVAASKFKTPEDRGSEDDYDHLVRTCNRLNIGNKGRKFDAKPLWDTARTEVEADFESTENRAAIIEEAEKVRLRVFPWATLPIVDLQDAQGENETPNQP